MTPEDEWLQSCLKADRERRAWKEALHKPPRQPRASPRSNTSDWWVLAVVLVAIGWGVVKCFLR